MAGGRAEWAQCNSCAVCRVCRGGRGGLAVVVVAARAESIASAHAQCQALAPGRPSQLIGIVVVHSFVHVEGARDPRLCAREARGVTRFCQWIGSEQQAATSTPNSGGRNEVPTSSWNMRRVVSVPSLRCHAPVVVPFFACRRVRVA